MDIALVFGGNEGIGLNISKKLIEIGYRVYAIGESFRGTRYAHNDYMRIEAKFEEVDAFYKQLELIFKQDKNISLVVYTGPLLPKTKFSQEPIEEICQAFNKQFLFPMLTARLVVNSLKEQTGMLVNIQIKPPGRSVIAQAVQGGLDAFFLSLFAEVRNEGVSLANIELLGEVKAQGSASQANLIDLDWVAECFENLLRNRSNNLVTHLTIEPQSTDQADAQAASMLPSGKTTYGVLLPKPENFPKEPNPILILSRKTHPFHQKKPGSVATKKGKASSTPATPQPKRNKKKKPLAASTTSSRKPLKEETAKESTSEKKDAFNEPTTTSLPDKKKNPIKKKRYTSKKR